MKYSKTDAEIIDELLQNVKTLHEENARLLSENEKLKKQLNEVQQGIQEFLNKF